MGPTYPLDRRLFFKSLDRSLDVGSTYVRVGERTYVRTCNVSYMGMGMGHV